jgi:hypothetical protein
VQHAAAVRVVDRVADIDESPQQAAQFQRAAALVLLERHVTLKAVDRFLERVAADEPHGVERPAVGEVSQAIYGNDAWMLEAAGDLGLGQESLAALRVVGVVVEHLLERHLTVHFGVEGNEHRPQAAAGMWAQHAESQAIRGGGADAVAGRAAGIVVSVCRGRAGMAKRHREVGIG